MCTHVDSSVPLNVIILSIITIMQYMPIEFVYSFFYTTPLNRMHVGPIGSREFFFFLVLIHVGITMSNSYTKFVILLIITLLLLSWASQVDCLVWPYLSPARKLETDTLATLPTILHTCTVYYLASCRVQTGQLCA